MSGVPQLSPFSSEFGLVQYIMQLQLGAPKFKIAELYEICEKKQVSDFNSFIGRLSNTNVVDVFLNVRDLSQPIADIIHKGIKIRPKEGLKIRVGSINLEQGVSSYQYIHCIVALGQVINFQDKNSDVLDPTFSTGEVPEGYIRNYDSVRLTSGGDFVIYKQEQIKSVHLVRFLGGQNVAGDVAEVHVCSNCGKEAAVWCEQDQVKLCAKCDKDLHSANKLLMNHKRKPIKEAGADLIPCPHHPEAQLQYFCEKCHMAVCMECKINGNHSKGEFQTHKLVPLAKAYKDAVDSLKKPTTTLNARTNRLEKEFKNADEKLHSLLESSRSVESEIMRIANQAIAQLKELANTKATHIKSAKMELKRKIDELNAIEQNLLIHKESSNPVAFLEAFSHRNELEEEVRESNDLPKAISGTDKYTVYGTLEVAKENPDDDSDTQFTETDAGMEPQGTNESTETREIPSKENEEEERNEMIYLKPAEKNPHYTKLAKIAARKEQKYKARNMRLTFQPFAESRILTDTELQQRLYMCLPFKEQPETHLMFSTYRDGRSIPKMHKMIDGKGITVILASANSMIFGGFAGTKWNCDGTPFAKGSSSFLFSITNDAFIPNKGQAAEQICLCAKRDSLTFGLLDLNFAGNFDDCHSELENSYGIGFAYGGTQAETFLAGSKDFSADDVEVWGFFAPDN